MPREEFDKLGQDNWATWSYRMEMLLEKMELWEVVSGEETKPVGSDNSAPVKKFRKRQRLARSEIALRVEDLQLVHTRAEDPKEIWEKLRSVHEAHGLGTRMSLRRRFHSMTKATDMGMQTFISTVEELARQLRSLGSQIDDEEIILVVTQGLTEDYETVIVALDALPPSELTLTHVTTRLLNEEARRSRPKEAKATDDTALMATTRKGTRRNNGRCYICDHVGHFARDCPNRDLVKEKNSKNHDTANKANDDEEFNIAFYAY
jgi:hypothetical protein